MAKNKKKQHSITTQITLTIVGLVRKHGITVLAS